MRMFNEARVARGFTLLEVLVALLILSIGLLGLAGMFSSGMRSNGGAYMRTQATLLAYDIADRMRANGAGLFAVDYEPFNGTAPSSPQHCATVGGSSATDCNAAQMAQFDLAQWVNELKNRLPSGTGKITLASDGLTYLITVSWDDKNSGSADTTFTTSFRP